MRPHRPADPLPVARALRAAAALLLALGAAEARAADPEIRFEKYRLKNGLTVILSEDHRLPQVAVDIWYHVGAANQAPGKSGFAHLFEHMMFSGSKHVQPSPFKVLEAIGTGGGAMANGTTNFDRTNYFEVVASSELPTALWIESDRMAFLLDTLDEKKLQVQRDVVSNERRQSYENRPYGTEFLRLCDLLYPSPHPYFECVIGSIPEIQGAQLADLKSFFRQYYGPNNASLALVGDFDSAEAKQLVEKYFGPVVAPPQVERPEPPPPQLSRAVRERVPDKLAEVPRLDFVWTGVKPFADDEAAGDVLADILGGGKTSRLYRSLVFDRQVASEVSAANVALGLGGWISAGAIAKAGHGADELAPLLQQAIDAIKKDGPTQAEVDRAVRKFVAQKTRQVERLGGFGGKADVLNQYQTFLGDPGYLPRDIARYRAVTPDLVKAFANRYLPDDRRLELDVEPAAAAPAAGAQASPDAGRAAAPAAGTQASAPQATPDASFRQSKPAPLPGQPAFAAPVPVQLRLKNGARLLVVENHNVPLVAVTVLIPAGIDADPPAQPGLADFVANMLDEGTGRRTAPQLSEAVEDLAARLTASAGLESTRVSLNSLKETLPQALDLLADVLTDPAFRGPDLERVRGLMLTELVQKAANPALLARDEMARHLWGPRHPWGQPSGGTPQSIGAITASDLRRFHQTWYRPEGAIVAVAGDVTPAEAQALLDQRLSGWKRGRLPRRALPAPPRLRSRTIALVDKPGASQSQVWVAGRLFPARHPDAVPLRVANFILGGLFGSRLNLNLRENKGYSYGVRSHVSLLRGAGTLLAAGGIVARNTPEALVEYEKELRAFASGEVTDEELARAKEAYVRSLPSALETDDAVAQSVATLAFDGRPLDEFKTLPERIARVTKADVRRVARRWIKPEAWPVVVVGPRAGNEEKLKALGLGPVEIPASAAPSGGRTQGAR